MDIVWHGSSKRDLMNFPPDAKSDAGHALRRVQQGLEPPDWKPMSSIGSGVREIRVTDAAGAFRVIYVAQVNEQLHVLHAFQKKTQKTAKHDIDLAKARFKQIWQERTVAKSVFEDLYPPAEARAMELRSQLLTALQEWIGTSGLKQGEIAELLGVDQPRVSDIKKGKLSRFTIDKLVEMAAHAGITTRMTLTRKAKKAA